MEKLLPQLRKLKEQNIEVTIAEAHLPLLESTMTARFEGLLNRDGFFDGVRDAVAAFTARSEEPVSRD